MSVDVLDRGVVAVAVAVLDPQLAKFNGGDEAAVGPPRSRNGEHIDDPCGLRAGSTAWIIAKRIETTNHHLVKIIRLLVHLAAGFALFNARQKLALLWMVFKHAA